MTLQLRLYGLGPTTGRRGHPYSPALIRPCPRCRAAAWTPCRGPRGGRRPYCRERVGPVPGPLVPALTTAALSRRPFGVRSRAYWLAAGLLHLGGAYGATAWRSVDGCWVLAGRMS